MTEVQSLREQLEKAELVLQFYANQENWDHNLTKYKLVDDGCVVSGSINNVILSDTSGMDDMFGGRRAREYFYSNQLESKC